MALGIRILYPENISENGTSVAAQFINYNNKYLVTEATSVTATLRIRAKAYDNFGEVTETPSVTDPIAFIMISNDSNFSSSRTLTLPYLEDTDYDVSSLTGYTGSPIITPMLPVDVDIDLNVMRISNWVLDTGEDVKKVYVKFITGGAIPQIFPATTESPNAWWDEVVVVKEAPSIPTVMQVDNQTNNYYVGQSTNFSWIESEDNISGLRGYNFDLKLTNDTEIIEECNSLDDFELTDFDEINSRILNDLPVMHTRYSSSYALGDYDFNVVSGQSKIEAVFSKLGATEHGQELQFENILTTDELQRNNYILEAILKPTTALTASGTQYLSIQNFDAMYLNGISVSILDGVVVVNADNGIQTLDAVIDVNSINGSVPYYSLSSLALKINVVPAKNTEPLYSDMASVHTNINNWHGAGADFILFEIDEDGAYHYVRPTWDGNELLTGYTRTTLSTDRFAEQITPNGVDQEIEFVYRENRSDVSIIERSDFGWYDILPINNTSYLWEEESFTILWQKIRITDAYNDIKKLQLVINSDETRDRLVWFSLFIARDGVDSTSGISGLPIFDDNNLDGNRKSNYAGIAKYIVVNPVSFFKSCTWNESSSYPEYDPSYYRKWNETVLVTPGRNVISFASDGFTDSSVPVISNLSVGKDYWIGLAAVGIKDNTVHTTEASWEFSDYRLNMQWSKLNKPIDAMLPETLVLARNRTQSSSNLTWINEYKSNTHTTDPVVMRIINSSDNVVYSTFPEDIDGDNAELVVNWNQVGADSIAKLMGARVFDVPKLKGRSRNFLAGFRNSDIPVADSNSIIYNDIRFSDNSLIPNIDLSDGVGYERQKLDLDEEETEVIVEQTTWTDSDWNRIWTKHYSVETGATITIDASNHLVFAYNGLSADSIIRASETHYLTPTGNKTCEVTTRFDLNAYSLDSEFYVAFLPALYESTVADISNITLEGNPNDLMVFGMHWNGDVYLYRPDVFSGDVTYDLIYTSGSLEEFDWNIADVKIRIDNNILPGSTSITIWHGENILYTSDYQRLFLPESEQGYYVTLGFRGKREPEYTLSLETGNFNISEVNAADYTQDIGYPLYGESMEGVPSQWWIWPGIEQINTQGASPAGSWFVAGTTQTVEETAIAKYNIAHRQAATYNISGHSSIASGIAGEDTLGPSGLPDYSRFAMYVNIDDIQTVPEFATISRWIGPYLLMGYGLSGVTAGDAYRWDFNYSFAYPENAGNSEIIFGMCNWLPTNEPATNSGEIFTTHQDYAVYSFTEDDLTENTKASIYALDDNLDTIEVGLTNGQYDADDPARYTMFSFVSDGTVKYTKGRLTSSGSSIDAPLNIGQRILPSFGKVSVVIRPKNIPGSLNPIVTLTIDDDTLVAGESTTLRWQSTNADYVDYNNFEIESDDLTGTKIITPSQSMDYTIRVKNNAGASSTATVRVEVAAAQVIQNAPVINSFVAGSTPVIAGESTTLSWNVSDATTITLNGGQFNNQTILQANGSIAVTPTLTTSYTLTAINSYGSVSRSVQISVQLTGSVSVSLSASESSIVNGGATVLTWSTAPASGVSLVSSNFGALGPLGTMTLYPEVTTTYTITVRNNITNEQSTANTTVTVGGYASGVNQYIPSIYLMVKQTINSIVTYHIKEITDQYFYFPHAIKSIYGGNTELREYYYLIPGPFIPGINYEIISSSFSFVCSKSNPYYLDNPLRLGVHQITSEWDLGITSLPGYKTLGSQYLFYLQNMPSLFTLGETATFSNNEIKNMTINWNNNTEPNYGILLSLWNWSLIMETTNALPTDVFKIVPNTITATLASPYHPTVFWRPRWNITYSSFSPSALSTEMVSMQSATDPQYVDVDIYVNDVLYASQIDVPLNFNTTDGIRFFVGARRKTPGTKYNTSSTVSKFALTLINKRTQPENTLMNDLALWSKTSGVLPANTLFYGRNINTWQDESYSVNMISGNSLLAQGFIPSDDRLQGISLKINSLAANNIVAYICAADVNGDPSLIPVNNHIVQNDASIIATSWARIWPGMQEAMFIFNIPVTLIPGSLYYIVFDYLTSAYGSSSASLMPQSTAYRWGTSSWSNIDGVLAFRVFSDIYVNIYNDIHAQRQNGRVAAVNNAGLISGMAETPVDVTVDLLSPHKPLYSSVAPSLYLSGHDGETYVDNYGSLMNLRIGAIDTDVVGSGIQDFRIVYWGNFDELLSTDFYQWNDTNADNYVDVKITYPGLFLDTKRVYAQVRDKVGNIVDTNSLYVSFKYAFYEDTVPPYLVRVRIEGDATIDPDPNEEIVTKETYTNNSLYVLDEWTGCKDFRVNHNFETSPDTGKLVYNDYQPYIPNFIDQLNGEDGVYSIAIQARDYGDNATQEHIEHIKTIEFEGQTSITELPTAIIDYQPQLTSYLYIATTKRTHRANISCINVDAIGYIAYTLYEPWDGSTRQTFKSTETIVVRVNGLVVSSSDYTADAANDWILFNSGLSPFDIVTIDIIEEVAVLYRYEKNKVTAVKIFDREGERAIGAMAVYNNTLYIGTDSGRIYAYNGIRTSSSVYRVSDGLGNYLPISTMKTYRFEGEDRDYLYVATYKSAQLYRYGGNVANSTLTWVRLTGATTYMFFDTDIFALEMSNNMLFIATGPYGKVYRYQRTYDILGAVTESMVAKQLYADEFNNDISFRMNVLCLKEFDNKVFAGVDYNSSVFSYQYLVQEQPRQNEWKELYNFNENFKNSPNPWEFYNQGNVDHNNTDKLTFSETYDEFGKLSNWSMEIKGEIEEYCLWGNKDTSNTWQLVSNSTGWMIDFDYTTISYANIDTSYQGIKIFDGTYEFELRIYANNTLKLISGENEAIANILSGNLENRIRIAVRNKNVTIYVNNDNDAVIEEVDFLELETSGKAILFGKIDIDSPRCYGSWKYLYYYINGILEPVLITERDFIRDQVIPFGKEIRYLEEVLEVPITDPTAAVTPRLIAGVQPRDASNFVIQDDPASLIPKTYVREIGDVPVWSIDATYPNTCAGIVGGFIYDDILVSIVETTTDALNYDMFNINEFMINTPYSIMNRIGNIYYRRRTQAYDSIIKDTKAPEGSIIIGENTAAGAVQVYSFEIYDKSNIQITEGFAARYSALDVEVESANNAIDGDPDTYDVIGTSEIRYLQQTFSETETVSFKRIKWGCKSSKTKTYKIEYLDINQEWVLLAEMQTDPSNINIFFDYVLSSEINTYAIRIYYSGDSETVQDSNYVTLSAHDNGIGVDSYRISAYQDFRDANTRPGADIDGWIPMLDGIITIDWNLISSGANWLETETITSPITAAIVFNGIFIIGTLDGRVYISSDGATFVLSSNSFSAKINTFTEWRDLVYLATEDNEIWESDNGLSWILTTTISAVDRISSLGVYNDILYVGTGNEGKLYTYSSDSGLTTLIKQFPSAVISSLYTSGSTLYIGLNPTGEIYTYNGESFTQAANLPASSVNQFATFDNKIFAACGNGKIYQYTDNWNLLFDSSVRNIIGAQTFTNSGPEISSAVEEGAGFLDSGSWRYKVTYINNSGIESAAGESYIAENTTNKGRLRISWQAIDSAIGYRLYRCPTVNGVEDSERLMVVNTTDNIITDTYFLDNGSYDILSGAVNTDASGEETIESNIAPPASASNYIWFAGDNNTVYVYDKQSMSELALPLTASGANGIIQFKGQIYVFGQARPFTDAELVLLYNEQVIPNIDGKILRYVGTGIGSGYKTVYCQYKDSIDNISDVLSDRIFYNNLIQKHVIEVEDVTGSIIDSYESTSSPTQKLYSPSKSYEQTGIYESEPFFAANLSRWDVIELVSQLPYNTDVELYVRTATSRDGLTSAAWNGPFELTNPNLEYDYYDRYGYYYSDYLQDSYFMDYSYYTEDEGVIESLSGDISYLSGAWIQFKLVLVTRNRFDTPSVFSVVIKYISTNAAMFYTTVFDLEQIANNERAQTGNFDISRGILTWNGVVPVGGNIQFGISTKNLTSYDWGDYQLITPNQVFEVEDPQEQFRIAAVLVSTDQETAIIDEWAILFECGDKDIKINLNQYIGLL